MLINMEAKKTLYKLAFGTMLGFDHLSFKSIILCFKKKKLVIA